jgi:hypothetical protein
MADLYPHWTFAPTIPEPPTQMTTYRQLAAKAKRQQREEERNLRALQRRAKEQQKLTALEQARLEVETFNAQVAALLSAHKDCSAAWDWTAVSVEAAPIPPIRRRHRELVARQNELLATAGLSNFLNAGYVGVASDAQAHDDRDFADALASYEEERAEWAARRALASRVLKSDHTAFQELLATFDPFADNDDVLAKASFAIHPDGLLECLLEVKGMEIFPPEVKSLTASGKVSAKAWPKGRLHEVYQDYVCSCVLRAARELFGLLPVKRILAHAVIQNRDPASGAVGAIPVLSVVLPRAQFSALPFSLLDPSDTIETFEHRGDVTFSRKSGQFVPIEPLRASDVAEPPSYRQALSDVVARARDTRSTLDSLIRDLVSAGAGDPTLAVEASV